MKLWNHHFLKCFSSARADFNNSYPSSILHHPSSFLQLTCGWGHVFVVNHKFFQLNIFAFSFAVVAMAAFAPSHVLLFMNTCMYSYNNPAARSSCFHRRPCFWNHLDVYVLSVGSNQWNSKMINDNSQQNLCSRSRSRLTRGVAAGNGEQHEQRGDAQGLHAGSLQTWWCW